MTEDTRLIMEQLTLLRTDVGELKTDVGELRTDVGGLRTDVGELRTDVGELRTDVGELKTDVAKLKERIGDLEKQVDCMEKRTESVEVVIKEIIEPQISIIAEGHLDLERKLVMATSYATEIENLKIRMKAYEMALREQRRLCDSRHVLAS